MKPMRAFILCGILATLAPAAAFAFINPKFTPADLARQSESVVVAALAPTAHPDIWNARAAEDLKGQSVAFSISVGGVKAGERDEVRKLLTANGKTPVILFRGGTKGLLHVDGQWLTIEHQAVGAWNVTERARKYSGTWAGGTTSLIRLTRWLLADPDASVPTSVGMGWIDTQADLGKLAATPAALATVELPSGDLCVFAALDSGDRLFRAEKNDETFEEITGKVKLATRSKQFAWADLDGDGRVDLASWDGKDISLWRFAKDGTLERADGGKGVALADCLALTPVGRHKTGTPALLVCTPIVPFLLSRDNAGAWVATAVPVVVTEQIGKTSSPCIVADFDGDGYWDVLQPRPGSGFLWRGGAKGLKPNEPSAVRTVGDSCRYALGDFDADGSLDVFLSDEKTSAMWLNDGKGAFRNATAEGGSMSYRLPAGASACVATDLNHDGRTDLLLLNAKDALMYHFNRGFGCFGEESELRIAGGEEGQSACAVADFNADGSMDVVVALADGRLRCWYNAAFEKPALRVSLAKDASGPVTVSAWQGEKHPVCVGAFSVRALPARTRFTTMTRDAVTLKWRAPLDDTREKPGGAERAKTITIPAQLPSRGVDVTLEP